MLRPFRMTEVERTFQYLDKTSHGRLGAEHLGPALRILAFNPTAKQLKSLSEVHCASGDFDCAALEAATFALDTEPTSAEAVTSAFAIFDEHGEGLLERDAFKETLKTLGDAMCEEEAEAAVQLADPQGVGQIDYAGFIALLFTECVPVPLVDKV